MLVLLEFEYTVLTHLTKYLTTKFEEEKIGGYPILGPKSEVSPKINTPGLPMTPLFLITESFSTLKMGMFEKI